MTRLLIHRRTLGALSAASAAFVCAPRLLAQTPVPLGRVTVAVGGQRLLYHLPLVLAERLGFFAAEGLNVAIQDHSGGSLALQAVRMGMADLCSGAYEHTIRQQVLGQSYSALVLQGRAPQMALGVAMQGVAAYKGLPSLAGHRIGVSALGSSTHLIASLMLAQAGLVANDVVFVGVGAGAAAVSAVRSGRVHALCHADPLIGLLEQKAGLRIAGDMRTLKTAQDVFHGTMPSSCLYAPQAFLAKKPDQAQALVNGVVHALKWLQTAAPADLIKALPASYLMGGRAMYLAAFNRVRDTFSPNGLMPDDGPATALRALTRVHPELAHARVDLASTYSNEWVRKARQKYSV